MDNNRNNRNDRHGNANNNGNNAAAAAAAAGPMRQVINHNNAAPNPIIDGAALRTASTCEDEPLANLQVIPMRMCQSAEYFRYPKMCEHKGVLGVMLSLRTAINDKASTVITQGGSKSTIGKGANARFRSNAVVTSARYDRIVHFADCSSNNGDVFACMLDTKTQSTNFFSSLRVGQEGIGDLILLEEVYPVDDTLGNTSNVPLMKRCSHTLPIDGDMVTLVPEVPLKTPAVGDTRYFCMHHIRLMEFGHVSIQTAICGGKLW